MPDLEAFSSPENLSQGFDPESYKQFQERIAEGAKQSQAAKKQEKKQKQQEDKLVKILLNFIRNNEQNDLIGLVSELLNDNFPAGLIISLILISEQEIQNETGLKLLQNSDLTQNPGQTTLPDLYLHGQVLPLEIKLTIEDWIRGIRESAIEYQKKLLPICRERDGQIKKSIYRSAALSLSNYLQQNEQNLEFQTLEKFMEFVIRSVINEIEINNGVSDGVRTHDLRDHNPTL
jgi:hypothetical protein